MLISHPICDIITRTVTDRVDPQLEVAHDINLIIFFIGHRYRYSSEIQSILLAFANPGVITSASGIKPFRLRLYRDTSYKNQSQDNLFAAVV